MKARIRINLRIGRAPLYQRAENERQQLRVTRVVHFVRREPSIQIDATNTIL